MHHSLLRLFAFAALFLPLALFSRSLPSVGSAPHGSYAPALQKQPSAQATSGAPVIINFANYQWDANYNWSQDSGPFVNGQLWSPDNAVVESDGLHLKLANAMIDGKLQFASADVELVANSTGAPFNPGFGTYLVSAKTAGTAATFNQFAKDPLAIFGAFTYEGLHGVGKMSTNQITGLPETLVARLKPSMVVIAVNYEGLLFYPVNTRIERIEGTKVIVSKDVQVNPGDVLHTVSFEEPRSETLINTQHELDLLEVSRFGSKSEATNAQFVLQPTDPGKGGSNANIKRITLDEAPSQGITVVMHWPGAKMLVTFDVYYGNYTLDNLPTMPAITYTTPKDQDKYVPDSSYQTFHLNMWQAFWKFNKDGNKGQADPAEIIVTNFQYRPN
jgi:hypothetical protein